jgi:hypothetical protein
MFGVSQNFGLNLAFWLHKMYLEYTSRRRGGPWVRGLGVVRGWGPGIKDLGAGEGMRFSRSVGG